MSLTGRPLVLLAAFLMLAVATATVLVWRRRWPAVRIAGLLLTEVLVVATAGVEYNRQQEFYPSWQALRGDTGTKTKTLQITEGTLDADAGRDIAWNPPGVAAWKLAAPPRLVIPSDYADRSDARFPVIVALVPVAGPALAAAHYADDVLTVVLVPTRETKAAALRDLPARLAASARVTPNGWDLDAAGHELALAGEFARTQPAGLIVARGWAPDQLAVPLNSPQELPAAGALP